MANLLQQQNKYCIKSLFTAIPILIDRQTTTFFRRLINISEQFQEPETRKIKIFGNM